MHAVLFQGYIVLRTVFFFQISVSCLGAVGYTGDSSPTSFCATRNLDLVIKLQRSSTNERAL